MAIGSAPEIGKEFITGGKIYYPWIEGDVQHQLMWGDSKVVYICGRPENVYSKFEWQCHKGCCGHDQGEPVNAPEEDLVESLLNMGELINQSQGVANVTMLSGDIFFEAAAEIERLRATNKYQRFNIADYVDLDDIANEIERLRAEIDAVKRMHHRFPNVLERIRRKACTVGVMLFSIFSANTEIKRLSSVVVLCPRCMEARRG